MSHLAPAFRVSVDDIRGLLVADAGRPSSLGAQLERVRDGTSGAGLAADLALRMECNLLREAAVLRCLDGLAGCRVIRWAPCPDLERHAKACGDPHGGAAIGILRAYEPWAAHSTEAGLAAVWAHAWHRRGGGVAGYPVAIGDKGDGLAHAFRHNRARVARRRAEKLLADCDHVLATWVELWNRGGRARAA